ncbi:hypothetical protein ACT5YR_07675 [Fructobacillus fructosus]|uniref:hypothetical protein n=1 Tax=Fructobacillus fructosus TaxID=1631 RepID=UPI0040337611
MFANFVFEKETTSELKSVEHVNKIEIIFDDKTHKIFEGIKLDEAFITLCHRKWISAKFNDSIGLAGRYWVPKNIDFIQN